MLLADNEQELKGMMKKVKKYIEGKGLRLCPEKERCVEFAEREKRT